MTQERVNLRTVDLDNCHKEPIQIPGSVQPHGVLLAFSVDGKLTHASRNAARFFPRLPPLGERPDSARIWDSPTLLAAADGMFEDAADAALVPPLALETDLDGSRCDVVLHAHAGRVLMEFERRVASDEDRSSFAVMAHRSMSRLKGRTDIAAILAEAVTAVRKLTGFDRVMAYRFHSDDSGEVVAESKADEIDTYVGRRFPASDIPVQARRLYVVNTLRLIADVNDEQVPIDAVDALEAPLDLSYAILRSVSPIHIEYLKNINVAASMSVSIVINGRLWGLIACHHRTRHRVPYAVRMACDVLGNVVATSLQHLIGQEAGRRRSAAADLRATLVELGADNEEPSVGTGPSREAVARVIASDLMLFSHGDVLRHDGLGREAAAELVRWLESQPADLLALSDLLSLPAPLRNLLLPLSGLLAMQHDRVNRGWVVLLRNEQTDTVTWSGPPDKAARVGPLGARLTPDGSLAEWLQDVRSSAVPWDDLDLELARQIMDEVRRATALRTAEMDRARTHLLAILGHDLRDPLHAINMATMLLERGSDQAMIARRISHTTGRMGRLISQVLDMSRLHGGLGLGLRFERTDLSAFIGALVEESVLAYPNLVMAADLAPGVEAEVDPDRLGQAIANLLGNARQHSTPGEPIALSLRATDGMAVFTVSNAAPALSDALVKGLFDPLKRQLSPNQRNPNGLGLGLYIANEAIRGHQGTIIYSHDGRHVVFTLSVPQHRRTPEKP